MKKIMKILDVTHNDTSAMNYVLKDHLGSLYATVTNGDVEYYSFDAWGRDRNHNTLQYDNISTTFDRGFCMHEHYRDFGLINMNGRMYDPMMSSFLSPDNYVQEPVTLQSLNRYAYCLYNPLKYIDPSGERCVGPNTYYQTDQTAVDYVNNERYLIYKQSEMRLNLSVAEAYMYLWSEGNTTNKNNITGGSNYQNNNNKDGNNTKTDDGDSRTSKDVYYTTAENLFIKTYWHYQFGGRKVMSVDASTMDLYYISQRDLGDPNENGNYVINLFSYSNDQVALALGNITLKPVGDNQYEILMDRYDFEFHEGGLTYRNVATFFAGLLHGPVINNIPIPIATPMMNMPVYGPSIYWGGSFEIKFTNTVYIKP